MNNELNTVEDIDALLDSQFNLNEESNSDDIEETDGNEDNEESDFEENQETDEDVKDDESFNEDDANEPDIKPSAEDKKEFAFSKMRKENSDLKSQLNQRDEESKFLSKIAAEYGYTDVKQFQEAYEKARIQKEAEKKGLDPVLYAQLQESNKRIAELESKQKEAELMNKAANVRIAVDKAVNDYNLGTDGKTEIFNRLEKAGFTVESLLEIPNPEILIKGILSDKIAELSKQKQIDKMEKLDNLSDSKHDGTASEDTVSLDDIIAKEMKQYKADNFYN